MRQRFNESHIKHQNGAYWVLDGGTSYEVRKDGLTHSTGDSAYHYTPDGLSIAIARCDYLANREKATAVTT